MSCKRRIAYRTGGKDLDKEREEAVACIHKYLVGCKSISLGGVWFGAGPNGRVIHG